MFSQTIAWTLNSSLFKVRFKVDLIVPQNEFVRFKTQNNFFLQSILGWRYKTKLESDLQVYEFVTGLLWPIVLENFLSKITLQNWFCAFWLVKTFFAVNQSSSQWVYNLRWNFFRGRPFALSWFTYANKVFVASKDILAYLRDNV